MQTTLTAYMCESQNQFGQGALKSQGLLHTLSLP